MLACGCAWLRSRFAPLTAVAASLFERCRLRRNAGLCLTRGMRGIMEGGSGRTLSSSLTMRGGPRGSLLDRVKAGHKHYPLIPVPMLCEEEGWSEGVPQ